MTYKVIWHEEISEDLRSIHISEAKKIILKIDSYLIPNPLTLGKALSAEYKGLFRYRFGNYRIIYDIDDKYRIIRILYIAHRNQIYNKVGRH